MKRAIVVITIVIFGIVVFKIYSYPNFNKIEDLLNSKRVKNLNQENWKETYSTDVKFDIQTQKDFSSEKVVKTKLYSGILIPCKEINKAKSQMLIEVLNDSSSYIWGEIGTPEFDKFLIFLDENDSIIGLTKIDIDKIQTHSEPMTRTMKWGFLSEKGKDKFYKILNE